MGFSSPFRSLPPSETFGAPRAQHSPYSANRAPFHQAFSVNVSNCYDPQNHLELDQSTKLHHLFNHILTVTKVTSFKLLLFLEAKNSYTYKLFSVVTWTI